MGVDVALMDANVLFINGDIPFIDNDVLLIDADVPFIDAFVPFIEADMPFLDAFVPFIYADVLFIHDDVAFTDADILILNDNIIEYRLDRLNGFYNIKSAIQLIQPVLSVFYFFQTRSVLFTCHLVLFIKQFGYLKSLVYFGITI